MGPLRSIPGLCGKACSILRRLGFVRTAFLAVVVLGILAGGWVSQRANRPRLCGLCHEMSFAHSTWQASTHRGIACEDCHVGLNFARMVRTKLGAPGNVVLEPGMFPVGQPAPAGAKVTDRVCRECHQEPRDELRYHLLRMTHREHVGRKTNCDQCHGNVVHDARPRNRHTPTMASCLRCHDGRQASNKCSQCHLQRGEIKPSMYNPAWVDWHRKTLKDTGPASCRRCHDEQYCKSCHQTTPPHPADWVQRHSKVKPADLVDCKTCHETEPGERMATFCTDCHTARKAHGPQFITTHPQEFARAPKTCQGCHEDRFCEACHQVVKPHPLDWLQKHGAASKVRGATCETCHTRELCEQCHTQGRPASHTGLWRTTGHGPAAMQGLENCNTCHKPAGCRQCHANRPPQSHRDPGWSGGHGPMARASTQGCRACHPEQDCSRCHQGLQMPHPAGWRSTHTRSRVASDPRRCAPCHTQEFCTTCHKGSVPASHARDWRVRHGATSLRRGARCTMCHSERFCTSCHAQPMPHPRGWEGNRHGIVAAQNPSSCATCHKHDDCLRCHANSPPVSHKARGFGKQHATLGPDGGLCDLCHGSNSCNRCHQGVPMPHSREFTQGGHGPSARERAGTCTVCHKDPKWCLACHQKTRPASHAKEGFKQTHGAGATAARCTMCHGPDACKTCHQKVTVSPHPEGFALDHKADARFEKTAQCFLCHKFDYCQQCHADATLK